jgi:hypothetical protein
MDRMSLRRWGRRHVQQHRYRRWVTDPALPTWIKMHIHAMTSPRFTRN